MASQNKSNGPIAFDLTSHHALGGGSYAFKEDFPVYLQRLLPAPKELTEINLVLQPNSSAHVGTLCNLILAFVTARRLQDLGQQVLVRCDLCDQAKGEETVINGIKYQRSLRHTGTFQKHIPEYEHLLQCLAKQYGVPYALRLETDFFREPLMPGIIRHIISNRGELGKYLMPSTGILALRAPCPECGLVDKYGVKNEYADDAGAISFVCPHHGRFSYDVQTEAHLLQFNCQLWNLIMGLFYERVEYNWIEICGSDYAGFWQEQLLWRFLSKPAIIVYAPLITDWSGAKVSKSLYLKADAYVYLKEAGMEYLLNYGVLRSEGRNLDALCREIELWMDEPFRLFRPYTLHYLHLLFEDCNVQLGVIHERKAHQNQSVGKASASKYERIDHSFRGHVSKVIQGVLALTKPRKVHLELHTGTMV